MAGNLTPKIGWNISGELTAQPALRNAFLVVRFHEQLNLRVGQANPYTALERGSSTLQLEFIDRSPVTSELTAGARVDITDTWFTEAAYRFLDVGRALTGFTPAGVRIEANTFYRHDLRLGFGYRF